MSTRTSLLIPALIAAVLTIAGCTAGGDDAPAEASSSAAAGTESSTGADATDGSGGSQDASGSGATGAASTVLAEQTFDATSSGDGDGDGRPGGTVTTTLRALEVSGETMTLRWAFRWDNPALADDASVTLHELAADNLPVLTDTVNLKQYRPLCAEGEWQGTIPGLSDCIASALVSPADSVNLHFVNHSTVEAWAVFAAPEDDGMSADLVVVDGWPAFSAVTPTVSE